MSNIEELRVDTNYANRATKMHPVMSIENKLVYMVTNKLFESRYKEISFPIITFSELKDMIESGSR